MVRICKLPCIVEDTDQWGRGLGTYSVQDVQGEIAESLWENLKAYEGYYESEEHLSLASKVKGLDPSTLIATIQENTPEMKRLIGMPNSLIWQFNMRVKVLNETNHGEEGEYVRSFGTFGQRTLAEWTPEHDEKVKRLQAECDRMNSSRSKSNEA